MNNFYLNKVLGLDLPNKIVKLNKMKKMSIIKVIKIFNKSNKKEKYQRVEKKKKFQCIKKMLQWKRKRKFNHPQVAIQNRIWALKNRKILNLNWKK